MNYFIKIFILIIFIIEILSTRINATANYSEYLFKEGNGFCQSGEYQKAIDKYNEILKMNYESPELYYNLGNCYYKLGKFSKAILYYERALKLNPNDEDIQFNLQIANMHIVDRVQKIPELFYIYYLKEFCSYFSIYQLTLISMILYILGIGILIFYLIARSLKMKVVFRRIGWVVGFLFIIFVILFSYKLFLLVHEVEAIVIEQEAMVKSAPEDNAIELFALHEGLKVGVTNRRGDWVEIKLLDGKEGWVKANSIEII